MDDDESRRLMFDGSFLQFRSARICSRTSASASCWLISRNTRTISRRAPISKENSASHAAGDPGGSGAPVWLLTRESSERLMLLLRLSSEAEPRLELADTLSSCRSPERVAARAASWLKEVKLS